MKPNAKSQNDSPEDVTFFDCKARADFKVVYVCCIVTLMVLVSIPAHAQGSLVLYDDFSTPLIDPARWFGAEPGQSVALEAVRVRSVNQDNKGQLHLAYRSYGSTDFDGGTEGAFLSLFFTNPTSVTAVRATVQVNKLKATGCPTPNSAPTSARAQITGRFFNTGTTPANDIGDVAATIEISQFSNETVLRVLADVFQCSATPCSQATSFGHLDLGVISLGSSAKLLIQWDQPNHQFIFQRDNGPLAVVPYMVSDTAPPFGQFKTLDIFNDVANCTATPRPVGFVDAFYSNVFVNASAVP
jgi:hypothetical protein